MKKLFLSALIIFTFGLNSSFAQKKKWVSLFDGKSMAGWHTFNKTGDISPKWTIDQGAIHLTEKGGGDLVTDQVYESFELELEWKIAEGGNSGVMWGVVEDKKYCCPFMTGPEMQVLDDAKHPDSFAGKEGNHKAGSLYDMLPPARLDIVKPANEWNKASMKINYKKNKGTFKLNGVKVVTFALTGPEWDAMKNNSKFKTWADFGAFKQGKIAIQDHGDKVWYKNIRIKQL